MQLSQRTLPAGRHERLFEAVGALKADAHQRGLTDTIIDQELAAYNAEGRETPTAA